MRTRLTLRIATIRPPDKPDPPALTMVPAGDTQLESKASALACRSKAEALDSSGPALRLAGTMTKPDPPGIVGTGKVPRFLRKPSPVQINVA